MTPLYYLRHFQNIFSFALRSQVRFKKVPQEADLKKIRIVKLQDELLDFLDLFNWEEIQKREPLILADVGCRDFSFAPVYERKFKDLGFSQMEVHGIEIDAYRRYTNLCSRADYGEAFARKIRNGFYHALDFMKFKKSVDIVFLFHPFVTPEPPLRWGLPLRTFKPALLFEKCFESLRERKGVLLLSNPSEREFKISMNLALAAGFRVKETNTWEPKEDSVHQRPRFGALFFI